MNYKNLQTKNLSGKSCLVLSKYRPIFKVYRLGGSRLYLFHHLFGTSDLITRRTSICLQSSKMKPPRFKFPVLQSDENRSHSVVLPQPIILATNPLIRKVSRTPGNVRRGLNPPDLGKATNLSSGQRLYLAVRIALGLLKIMTTHNSKYIIPPFASICTKRGSNLQISMIDICLDCGPG